MQKALVISQLKKTYKNGFEALKGIDLEVQQGDFFALLGSNGAGKSTIIGIISALVNKTCGKVKIFGYDIDKDLEAAKSYLGLVPQEFNFNQFETPMRILINQAGYYGVPRQEARRRAEKYLKQMDLWDKRDGASRMLSGGMKRRLMIARALMHQPRMLILDEPTAGIDIELRRGMRELLRTLNKQGMTIILTTHYLEEAEMLCRNIGIIDRGIIIENTSIKALLAKLNMETFILDIKPNTQSIKLEGFTYCLIDGHTLEVDVEKSQAVNTVFTQLSQQNIEVLSLRNKTNRLEILFVNLIQNQPAMDSGARI